MAPLPRNARRPGRRSARRRRPPPLTRSACAKPTRARMPRIGQRRADPVDGSGANGRTNGSILLARPPLVTGAAFGSPRMSPSSQRVTRATLDLRPRPIPVRSAQLTIDVAAAPPPGTEALGVPVATSGDVPSAIGVDRAPPPRERLHRCARPDARPPARGSARSWSRSGSATPAELDTAGLRDAAAAFARAAARDGVLATTLGDVADVDADDGRPGDRRGRAPGPLPLSRVRRPSRRGAADRADPGRDGRPRSRGLEAGAARGRDHWPKPSRSPATWRTRPPPTSPRPGWPRSPGSSGPRPASRSRSSTTTRWSSSAAAGCSA